MGFSLTSLFKRKSSATFVAAPKTARASVEKVGADRLSKTVMPNVSRPSMPLAEALAVPPSAPAAPRVVTLAPVVPSGRTTPVPAIVSTGERMIPLLLGELVAQLPDDLVRPLTGDEAARTIALKAADLERGMANGRPMAATSALYEQAPDIFLRPLTDDDRTEVPLPFAQVLEQFTRLQQRADQQQEAAVPEVETPFLQVTLEDNHKFGGSSAPVAPRAPVAAPVPVSAPAPVAAPAPATPPPPAPAPTRIPFTLSPNGAGAPVAERVPASGNGASVPTSATPPPPPVVAPSVAPTRIPFSLGSEPAKREPWLTAKSLEDGAIPAAVIAAASPPPETKIVLPLRPILRALPPFQLAGEAESVDEETTIELPFALVEAQLASGRVSIPADKFASHLPASARALFNPTEAATPVALPLQDVLRNLPTTSLRLREDQVEPERGPDFITPFSATAEEDEKRFQVSSAPVSAPAIPAPEPEPVPPPVIAAPEVKAKAPVPLAAPALVDGKRTALQELLQTDATVDAKAVVAFAGKLPGVAACTLLFNDGLHLAGNLPENLEAEGLCAMAPSFLQRLANHLGETKLGRLEAMTLSCAEAQVTFLTQGNLCLGVTHADGALADDVRRQLGRLAEELSITYTQSV